MARIAIFSKYFGYDVGGAERSVLAFMRSEEMRGHQVVALVNETPKHFGAMARPAALPASWNLRGYRLPHDFLRFRNFEYVLNKKALRRLCDHLHDVDILYAYGNLAPCVLNAFKGKTVYLVRDEYGLGWNKNYHKGTRRVLQAAYHALEAPLRALWKRELRTAIERADLIANSGFIAAELAKMASHDRIKTIAPEIDLASLRREYGQATKQIDARKGIVMIGDSVLKGTDIFRKIACRMPTRQFYVFDRAYTSPVDRHNVRYMPWQNAGAVYAHAALVLVPSRWSEAFGRVAKEAGALGIPVVASNTGGLPEAVAEASFLHDDIEDIDGWIQRIERVIARESGP